MTNKYILREKTPILEPDLIKWAKNFETEDRRVAQDVIGDVKISTVFLGVDHSFGISKPLLFETMVFGGKFDQEQDRYSTWDEAVQGHKNMVDKVNATHNPH